MGRLPNTTQVEALAIDPRRPERVYAAGPGGVFRSNDAGQTWEAAGEGLPAGSVAGLSLDPDHPDRVYAATSQGGIFRSDDEGKSWRSLG